MNKLNDIELIKKVEEEVSKMCKTGGKSFTMRVPVDENNDTDILISEMANRFKRLISNPNEAVVSHKQQQPNKATTEDFLLVENRYAILILDSMKLKFFRNKDDFAVANQTLLDAGKRLSYFKKLKNDNVWVEPDKFM